MKPAYIFIITLVLIIPPSLKLCHSLHEKEMSKNKPTCKAEFENQSGGRIDNCFDPTELRFDGTSGTVTLFYNGGQHIQEAFNFVNDGESPNRSKDNVAMIFMDGERKFMFEKETGQIYRCGGCWLTPECPSPEYSAQTKETTNPWMAEASFVVVNP